MTRLWKSIALLKRYKEDTDRQDWEKQVYKRGWEVAWGKKDALWSDEEKNQMINRGQIPIAINDVSKGIQGVRGSGYGQ
jgi:hypothetical protein